ncbi:MAG: hypothetical protein QN183_01190 [Armatimonadota bacterium]|nr:hypothetical protein [Armatimonadota bacterium]MDR7534965.1 hypothetical protein [Armatimonadota bacterium]
MIDTLSSIIDGMLTILLAVAGTGLLAAFGLGRLAGRGAAGAADRLEAQAE